MSIFSVTNETCKCSLIERLARDETKPVVFDFVANEYQLKYNGGSFTLYHCFLCGGMLPKSGRASLFYTISDDEQRRLYDLTKNINTLDAAISAFGRPDYEYPETTTDMNRDQSKPDITRTYRTLAYSGLSDKVTVLISDHQERGLKIYFQGKEIKTGNEKA